MITNAPQRQRRILELLEHQTSLPTSGLPEELGVAAMARQVLPRNVTIVTNSLHTAQSFQHHASRPVVYCCCGLLREASGTFIGREALAFFSKRRFQRYFLSATGVDAEAGITDLTLEDNEVKRAMAASSDEVVLMADRTKLGVVSHMEVMPWRRITHVINDAAPSEIAPIRARAGSGVPIHHMM